MKYRMNVKKWLAVAGAVTAGTALIYFLDPKRGAYRRAYVAHQFNRAVRQTGKQWDQLSHQASEATAQAWHQRPWRDWTSDTALETQVRNELDRLSPHGDDIDVKVDDGRIYLRGWATPRAVRKLMKRAKSIGGVASIENQLALR